MQRFILGLKMIVPRLLGVCHHRVTNLKIKIAPPRRVCPGVLIVTLSTKQILRHLSILNTPCLTKNCKHSVWSFVICTRVRV